MRRFLEDIHEWTEEALSEVPNRCDGWEVALTLVNTPEGTNAGVMLLFSCPSPIIPEKIAWLTVLGAPVHQTKQTITKAVHEALVMLDTQFTRLLGQMQ